MRASALAEMADELDLGAALLLGKGEDATGGRAKPSILADALEAVIGAVYLDGGLGAGPGRSCSASSAIASTAASRRPATRRQEPAPGAGQP